MKKTSITSLLIGALLSQAGAKELKVFILAGQSNMVGYGSIEMGRKPGDEEKRAREKIKGGLGSLRYIVEQNKDQYGSAGDTPLIDKDGEWIKRDDVLIHYTTEVKSKPKETEAGKELSPLKEGRFSRIKKGNLSVGFANGIGPEFAFGHIVGNAVEEPVLLIKVAWGGKDLAVNFRPPSSGPSPFKRKDPEVVGRYYRAMMATIKDVLANYETEFPELKGYTPRLVGFGWHQGWNDGSKEEWVAEYEKNMVNFIKDVRKDLAVKDLPFVIANSGMIGWREGKPKGRRENLCDIQMAVGDPEKHPEFKGTVASVETRDCYRSHLKSPSNFGYHWHHSGESQFCVGKGMGEAMLKLLAK